VTAAEVRTGPSLVIAADSVRARLFAAATPGARLREMADLLNPEARLHENDIVEDSAGRRGTRPTQGKRSAFGGSTGKRHRAEEFAARVCERAAKTLRDAGAERLYLVAEPEFLGLLRKRLNRTLQRRVAGTVAKSVVGKPAAQIRAALPPRL
jgi:protein required for attachment to host cells